MIVRQLRCLRGSNVWCSRSVYEAALDLTGVNWSFAEIERALHSLFGDNVVALEDNADPQLQLAQAIAFAARKLQNLAGTLISFSGARPCSRPGHYLAAAEFVEETVGQAAMEAASRLLLAAKEGGASTLETATQFVHDAEYKQRLPISTAVVYNAAKARNIPATRLNPEYRRYLRLGQGSKQHRFHACEPDTTSAIARMASTDKQLAKQLLAEAGVPVPQGRVVESLEQAWAAASELGFPVAVKPLDADLGTGVSLDLRTREQVEAAFREAEPHGGEVLVERFAPGLEHRVVVVGDRVVAVARIEPPHVVGDGVSTIAQLAALLNQDPRRGEADSKGPLFKLKLDDVALEVLAGQGCTLDSVPAAGATILLRRNPPYIAQGGNLADVTDIIHPETAAHAIAAAHAVQLPVAGLDVVALDITQPLEGQRGVVVEINTSPGLWLHLAPVAQTPRPVGEDIVAALFPPGSEGRIPVIAIVGDATGAAANHLTSLLAQLGLCAGSASAGEICIDGRRWTPPTEQTAPHERAGIVFQTPIVDVALLHISPLELVRCGLGNDRCDVAIVFETAAPVDANDLGPAPSDFAEALANGLFSEHHPSPDSAPRAGTLVWRINRPLPFSIPSSRHIQFAARALESPSPLHLASDGRAVIVQGEQVVLIQGTKQQPLGKLPVGLSEPDLAPLLAALAAALALGHSAQSVGRYLS